MISRRQFLVGTAGAAAGLILPDWLVRAERHVAGEGAPLLEVPDVYFDTLTAVNWGDGEYELFLGDPNTECPTISWETYMEEYRGQTFDEHVFEELGDLDDFAQMKEADLRELLGYWANDPAPYWAVVDDWAYNDSPSALAFSYLDSLDLGPEFGRATGRGDIRLLDGVCPGNDSRIVTAADDLSLSLLQKRLNDLGEDIRIVVGLRT